MNGQKFYVFKDFNRLALIKRVIELEKRGFECVSKIQKKSEERKTWSLKEKDGRLKKDYKGSELQEYYLVKMKRIDTP